MRRIIISFFFICNCFLLSGCSSIQTQKLQAIFQQVLALEAEIVPLREQQRKLEFTEHQVYRSVVMNSTNDLEVFQIQMDTLQNSVEERRQLGQIYERALSKRTKEIQKSLDMIVTLKGQGEIANLLRNRCQLHRKIVIAYDKLLDEQSTLYHLLASKTSSITLLQQQITLVNEHSQVVQKEIQTLNQLSEPLNAILIVLNEV